MKFSEIPGLFPEEIFDVRIVDDFSFDRIEWDYTQVSSSSLYVCLEKEEFAESHFLGNSLLHWPEARKRGAPGVLCEANSFHTFSEEVNRIGVRNLNRFFSRLLKHFYADPFSQMKVIGICGTNGKTTTSQMIARILTDCGINSGVIGTIGIHYADRYFEPSALSNPPANVLFSHAHQMVQKKVTHLVTEVTSHAMALDRNTAIDFDIGVFTNFTPDHLDYHETLENYFSAKLKFFRRLGTEKKHAVAILNFDDPKGEEIAREIREQTSKEKLTVISYGVEREDCDFRAEIVSGGQSGSTYKLYRNGNYEATVSGLMAGKFNVYNSLAAIAATTSLGFQTSEILASLKNFPCVQGRFEKIPNTGNIHVYVDYAHTPDALSNILTGVREIAERRVICVFGCGGDRDRTKRPEMGKIAAEAADFVWVTSDNPRTEDPGEIIRDILRPLQNRSNVFTESDRAKAIDRALDFCKPGDSLVIAGKGHENYQIIGKQKLPFSDRGEVLRYFKTQTKRAALILHPSALEDNLDLIFEEKPSAVDIFAVLKDNALGFGLPEAAKIAERKGCAYLCVACLSEALQLRENNILSPVLIFGERLEEEFKTCVQENFTLQIQSYETAEKLNQQAEEAQKKVKVHLKVDTGMGRYGVRRNHAGELFRKISLLEWVEIEGVMTHFAQSDEAKKDYAREQFKRFKEALKQIGEPLPKYIHACNSGGYLDLPEFHCNAVRIGHILAGVYPSAVCRRIEKNGRTLRPVFSLETRIAFLKDLFPGDCVGYGMHFTAEEPMKIAVLPIGYGDGYPRLRNKGEVLIRGRRYPIIGGIAMDAMMIDLRKNPDVAVGDRVTLIGRDDHEEIRMETMAKWAGTVTYDLMARWSPRLEKIYKN